MRRAALAIALTIAGLVFLLSYQVPMTSIMSASSAATMTEGTGTLTGTADGPVQVRVTLSSGKITRVSVPVRPDQRRRPRARARERAALARLIREALTAQGPRIRKVAGSGSLSAGFISSLRSALRHAQGSRAGHDGTGRASAGRAGHGHHGRRKAAQQHGGAGNQPGGR